MGFPNFRNKHREVALFSAENYVRWAKNIAKNRSAKPEKFILIYYPYLLNYFKRKYGSNTINVNRLIRIHQYKNIGVVLLTGIGSPHAVVVLEEIIALGGKEFLNIGSCGGLNGFGVFLLGKAIRDEGTSHHYAKYGKYSYPNKELTDSLGESLSDSGLVFKTGTSWTIDAPYRETKAEIKHYRREGVDTVEMEASALFAVARARKVKLASAVVVSDVLGDKQWDPQFDSKHFKTKLKRLLDSAVDCLIE
jgi:uridine phosphorylase